MMRCSTVALRQTLLPSFCPSILAHKILPAVDGTVHCIHSLHGPEQTPSATAPSYVLGFYYGAVIRRTMDVSVYTRSSNACSLKALTSTWLEPCLSCAAVHTARASRTAKIVGLHQCIAHDVRNADMGRGCSWIPTESARANDQKQDGNQSTAEPVSDP